MSEHVGAVFVGGLPITPFRSMKDAVSKVIDEQGVEPGFAIAINAEKVISALASLEVRERLMTATLLYADGISVVKTLRKKGVESARIPGCEFWVCLMKRAGELNKSVYLLGATEETNLKAANKLEKEFGLEKLYRRNGYFESEQGFVDEIQNLSPDIVTVALGSPKQELLIAKMREKHPDAFYMGVGGSYDVFVGNVSRAPKWLQSIHLEWLFRLVAQPTRLMRQIALIQYLWMHLRNEL